MSDIPKLEQEITAGLRDLREILSQCSTKSVAGMCFAQGLAEDKSPDHLMSPAKQIAFLLGVLLEDPEPNSPREFDARDWSRVKPIVNRLFSSYMLLYMPSAEDKGQPPSDWFKTREVAMSAFLHHFNTGLLASVEQIADRVIRYLAPYDDASSQLLGISVTECLSICKWIGDKLQQSLDEACDLAEASRRHYEMLCSAAVTQISPERYVNLRFAPIMTKMAGAMQRIGIVSLPELKNAFPRTAEIFWRLFSIARGSGPALRYPTELSEFELRPLIQIGESRAFCPSINAVYGAVLLVAENALLRDNGSCSRYLRSRDKALEREALEILCRFFGAETRIWSEVYETSDAQFEHDLVIADDTLCLVVEAKASPPVEPFRDPDKAFVRLQRAFRADTGLQKAFDQAHRLCSRIRSGERVCLYDRNGEQVGIILPNKERSVVATCVTRDNFGLLATNLALLLEKREEDPYPWVVNVLDLWSLAEGWEYLRWSSRELRDYIQQRIQLHGKVISDDELDYAGSFIKHGSFSGFAKGNVLIQLNIPQFSMKFTVINT